MSKKDKNDLCFVDSNIWLYAFVETQDKEKSGVANRLVRDIDVVISTQVINEICFNLLRKAQFAEENLKELISSFFEKYNIVEINGDVLMKASALREHYSFSFWDSIIVASALNSGALILYSEDMKDGLLVERKLKIVNPFSQK